MYIFKSIEDAYECIANMNGYEYTMFLIKEPSTFHFHEWLDMYRTIPVYYNNLYFNRRMLIFMDKYGLDGN